MRIVSVAALVAAAILDAQPLPAPRDAKHE
jgi:hypothetical protein